MSHLSSEMRALIKQIGETRSKQEEDKIILYQQSQLQKNISKPNQSIKQQKENLINSIYIEMLGHDASFAQITAINLTRQESLQLKRLGYLCCTLFFNEENEKLVLLIANIQRDLKSKDIHSIVIALTALQAVIKDVQSLLTHKTDIIRKKSLLCLQRINQLAPGIATDYHDKMTFALQDKEHSVIQVSINMFLEQLKEKGPQEYYEQTSSFVILLKSIIDQKVHKDYSYHNLPAPWMQIKLLQVLSILGRNNLKVSEQMFEILGQTLRRSDDINNDIGVAITYQCIKTISSIYPSNQLLESAANSITKLIGSQNMNQKFLGLNALIHIFSVDPKYVMSHQITIIDCLESKDETLKKETLELLFKMTNQTNIQQIMAKILHFLRVSQDPTFKKDLVQKITLLAEQYSPSKSWYLDTMNTVFEFGAEFIDNNLLNNFLSLVQDIYQQEGDDFGEMLIKNYSELYNSNPSLPDVSQKMIVWVLGEIGSIVYNENQDKIHEIIGILLQNITNEFENPEQTRL